jgi:glucose/mannose-6-phosphate isomerase
MTMYDVIAAFPEQLREAVEIGKAATINKPLNPIRNILVTGLGGSGMGANVVIDLLSNTLRVPMAVNKDYHLPNYVNKNTLLIASSYSGNTEETVMALQQGIERGAKIVCVTSGGKMAKMAKDNGLDLIMLPAGRPPRGCLGYSMVQQLFILHKLGFMGKNLLSDLEKAADMLDKETDALKTTAQKYAKQWHDKLPILYAPEGYGSVAIRWRQQINENGKMLCWHHVIPEMNHNELVGWRTESDQWLPIFFNAPDVFVRNQYRIEINKTILNKYSKNVCELKAKGRTHLQRLLYLMFLGDWVSWYLAEQREVDAMEVKVIDYLKGELEKR